MHTIENQHQTKLLTSRDGFYSQTRIGRTLPKSFGISMDLKLSRGEGDGLRLSRQNVDIRT